MAECPEIRIEGVSREVWNCLWRRAREMRLSAEEAPSGTLEHPDADAAWRWDEASGTLVITVTRPPARVDCAWVEQRLRETARACGAA